MTNAASKLTRGQETMAALIFFAFGLSSISVFNTLTVPADLWEHRMGNSDFMFNFPTFFNSTYLPVQIVNLFWIFHLPSIYRLIPGIVLSCIQILYVNIAFPLAPQSQLGGLQTALYVMSVIGGFFNSVFQGALFSVAAAFESKRVFTGMMAGQGLSGLLPAVVRMFQTLYETTTDHPISDTTWYVYFALGQLSSLPAVFALMALYMYRPLRNVMDELREMEYWGIIPPKGATATELQRRRSSQLVTPILNPEGGIQPNLEIAAQPIPEEGELVPQIPQATPLERENAAQLLGDRQIEPAPTPAGRGERELALTPMAARDIPAPVEPQLTAGQALKKTFVDLFRALRTCWAESLALFFIFAFTLAFYPGVVASFKSSATPDEPIYAWWTTLSLFWFLLADYIGRQLPDFSWAVPKSRAGIIIAHVLVYARIPICILLFWFCFSTPSVGIDVLQALTTFSIFGLANGYLSTLMVAWGPTHSSDPVERNMAGAWCSLALNAGLTVGGFLPAVAKYVIH